MNCELDHCEGKAIGRGMCRKHYTRWYRFDNPSIVQGPRITRFLPTKLTPEAYFQQLVTRFWKYVDKSPGQGPQGDCWEWRARPDA